MSTAIGYASASIAFLALYLGFRRYLRSNACRYPPGPKGSFIIGNALQMPKEKEWLTYTKWGKIWGNIVYVRVFSKPVVFLNSYEVAVDLLDKRGAIYSDRPVQIMGKLAKMGNLLGLTPYNERLRKLRRSIQKVLNPEAVKTTFHPLIETKIRDVLLDRFMHSPLDFRNHIQTMASSIMMKLAYGYEVTGDNDVMVDIARDGMRSFSEVSRTGVFLVEFLPALQYLPDWFPGTGFKKVVRKAQGLNLRMVHTAYDWAKKTVEEGTAAPSFASKLMDDKEEEDIVMYASTALIGGGSHTVVSTIASFVLAMTLFPSVQEKAQEEIDRMVGRDRLPTFSDVESLQYVDALMKEVYRWNPVAPLGMSHVNTKDDVYAGYFIPKGTVVIANIWGMLHDDKTYKDPMVFNPDRFLSALPEKDPRDCAFGFGRRICPGINVAIAEVYLSIVQTLAMFKISKALDADGKEIDVDFEYSSGTVSMPSAFQCRIEKRFKGAEKLIGL